MRRFDFNTGWTYKRIGTEDPGEEQEKEIRLPHDAMLSEPRAEKNPGKHNTGYFAGNDYLYAKPFFIPQEWKEKTIILEFEGVYRKAEVYLNGEKIAYRPYGYTNFFVKLDQGVKYGEENLLQVIARNKEQPNSRWYSGAGLYRPVWMYVGEKGHIPPTGVFVRTTGIFPARLEFRICTSMPGSLVLEIWDGENCIASRTSETAGEAVIPLELPDARLWSADAPYLYHYRVKFRRAGVCSGDCVEGNFGIRLLEWNRRFGLLINGERVILRGACIHHDNGLLGACCYPEAEERKVRILKENGYNALRSAHNPCSKALLDACDRLGMLVMDEYTDMWYIHKTAYDYADDMEQWWKEDLKDMVEKDYNHPSVILYSTGNEVAETAQKRGILLTKQMTEYLHGLDAARPVTCGINIFFNLLSSMGFGVYSDKKAKKEAGKNADERNADRKNVDGKGAGRRNAGGKNAGRKNADERNAGRKKESPVGSEFYNTLAGIFGDTAMKIGARLHGSDVKTRDAYAEMDIAGYNYGILRYEHDLKKYPERLILGSETFCRDAYRFFEKAKRHPGIIGDFVWAGMDYIGETGIGAWEYEDYAPKSAPRSGWLTAGSGRIDITGNPLGEAAYTRVAFECTEAPLMAVRPVYQSGKHSPSAWKMTDAIASWSWTGCSGRKAVVEVYTREDAAELYLNERLVKRKKRKKDCRILFQIPYEDGELCAVTYSKDGKMRSSVSLKTAGKETVLRVIPEEETGKKDGLCYVRIRYTDEQGILKPMEKHRIHVKTEGGSLLGLGNGCPYNPEGYLNDTTDTYYGEALAIVRAENSQEVKIIVTDEKNTVCRSISIR